MPPSDPLPILSPEQSQQFAERAHASKTARVEDRVDATVDRAVRVDGRVVSRTCEPAFGLT